MWIIVVAFGVSVVALGISLRLAMTSPRSSAPTATRLSPTTEQPIEVRLVKLELELTNLSDRWDNTVDLLKRQAVRVERANQRAEKIARERDGGDELEGPAGVEMDARDGSGGSSPFVRPVPTNMGADQSPLAALKRSVESLNGRVW